MPSHAAQSISISRASVAGGAPLRIVAVSTARCSGLDTQAKPSSSAGVRHPATSARPASLSGMSLRPCTMPFSFHDVGP